MRFHRPNRRRALAALGCLAVAGTLFFVGCGPSGVESSPSSKDKLKEFYANGGQNQVVTNRRTSPKKFEGPSNIKKRLFAAEPGKALPKN